MAAVDKDLTYGAFGTPTNSVSSLTSASGTPTASRMLIAFTRSTIASGAPAAPTLTSTTGVTWTQYTTFSWNGNGSANDTRLTIFYGLTGGSPTAGTHTADWGGVTQSSAVFGVNQFVNTALTGTNGADAIKNLATGTGADVAFAGTLAALKDSNSYAAVVVSHFVSNQSTTAGTGLSVVRTLQAAGVTGSEALLGTTTAGSASTALSGSWSSSSAFGFIGFELAGPVTSPATPGGPANLPFMNNQRI